MNIKTKNTILSVKLHTEGTMLCATILEMDEALRECVSIYTPKEFGGVHLRSIGYPELVSGDAYQALYLRGAVAGRDNDCATTRFTTPDRLREFEQELIMSFIGFAAENNYTMIMSSGGVLSIYEEVIPTAPLPPRLSHQERMMLNYMRNQGHITQLAGVSMGILNIKGRIADIRRRGYRVTTRMCIDGRGKSYARYSMDSQEISRALRAC